MSLPIELRQMNCKQCPVCEAKWIDDQLFWSTGAKGTDADLAGLVCDNIRPDQVPLCINKQRGLDHGGDTWEKRAEKIDQLMKEAGLDG